MTATTSATLTPTPNGTAPRRTSLDLSPLTRAAVGLVGVGLTAASALAITRYAAGLAPDHPGAHLLAVAIHVAAVVPGLDGEPGICSLRHDSPTGSVSDTPLC